VSGAKASRPHLDACLVYLREGDQLVVWKLDWLGRSVSHLVHMVEDLGGRGVQFVSLTEGFDTSTVQGRLLFHILAALAEMERELIRERTLAGIERAKAEGRMGGRKRVMSPERIRVASAMLAEGRPVAEVAKVLGVGRATLYRALPIGGRTSASDHPPGAVPGPSACPRSRSMAHQDHLLRRGISSPLYSRIGSDLGQRTYFDPKALPSRI
jgi:DNA invertase Pin-like site-specific DNA recombinase